MIVFSRAGIVRKQEPERLTRDHFAVHRRNLVRQWIHKAGVNRQIGGEEMSELVAVCLCHQ
ncbi:hypothetical protein [Antarctobacter sp.]|uniref:hypothetical protein n=1 Tax=Antarctobacter sp. TaxID=1872577 RepID=UPI002B269613|nr:hypothetical protein [Antarctobacter sp.]